jgi:DNA-directed RNA polymerase subunit RPC12/RpoP
MFLITMRLADMRRVHPNQITGKCSRCGEEVGIYPSGQEALKKHKDLRIVCHICRPWDGTPEKLAPGAFEERWESKERDDDE